MGLPRPCEHCAEHAVVTNIHASLSTCAGSSTLLPFDSGGSALAVAGLVGPTIDRLPSFGTKDMRGGPSGGSATVRPT